MIKYGGLSSYTLDRFLEPCMRGARQCLMIRTDATLHASNCVCMYTVQCRVIVDNKCEFQLSSHCDCNFDARLVSKTRKDQQTTISEIRQDDLRSPTQVQHTTKKEDTFTPRRVWIVQNSSVLPPDPCPTNPMRHLGQMHFVQSIQSVKATNCFRTQPSPEIRAYPSDPSSVKTTPQMTPFRDVQQAIVMATVWIDDDKIKSDYYMKKTRITYAWWSWATRRPTPMTTWHPRPTQCTWNATPDKWVCTQSSCSFCSVLRRHLHSLHTTSRGSSCARVSSHPCMKWASLFDFELSIPSNFLFSLFIFNFPQLLVPFYFYEVTGNTAYSANKEMGSTDDSQLLAAYEPKNDDLMETYVESFTESLTQPQFSEQRFLEDVDYDDAALEEMLHNAHREHVYHSQREGLSVDQSSSSMSERTGETRCWEQGDLLWKEVRS